MIKWKFEEFDFRAFNEFIFALVDKYQFWNIQFNVDVDKKYLFTEYQLTHAAPNRILNAEGGFIGAWMKKQNEVRRVGFDFARQDDGAKFTMSIDLDKRYIELNKIEGIVSLIQIEEVLKNNMQFIEGKSKVKQIMQSILKFVVKHILVEIIIGLIIVYLSFKFGWK